MSVLYTPTQLEKALKTVFLKQAGMEAPNLVDLLATRVPSGAADEKYAWIGEAPQMVEIEDEIRFSALTDTGYTLTNIEYGAGIIVKTRDIKNDQTGGIKLRVQQLASVAMRHPNKLLIDALVNGTTLTGYDGLAFFADSHTARGSSGIIDNLLAGSGTTTANVQTDINAAIKYFGTVLAENGEPFNGEMDITKLVIVAPYGLRKPVLEAIGADLIYNNNQQVKGLEIVPVFSGRITADANDWYCLNVSGPLKPLIFQEREPVTFSAQEQGDIAFVRKQYMYKAESYCKVGYGPFQQACKFVNT